VSTPKLHPLLGTILFPIFAAIVQLAVIFYAKHRGVRLFATPQGIRVAAVGGLFLGLYTVFVYMSLARLPVSKVSPVVYIGGVLISVLFGIVFLKESLSWVNIIGIVLSALGLTLVFMK